MDFLLDPAAWASLITLTSLEIILGVDNIVVLSILTGRLPKREAQRARRSGLLLALVLRLLLLTSIASIIRLTAPLFYAGGFAFSWRDLILIGGGIFLIVKATQEIHREIEGADPAPAPVSKSQFRLVIAQIAFMDLIFSIDSIVTAVGLAQDIEVMAAAICIAVAIMFFAANITSNFIERHPTLKMLALAFLILIGAVLVADGFGTHLPRAYIYFAMGFAALVEALNIWAKNSDAAATKDQSPAFTAGPEAKRSPPDSKPVAAITPSPKKPQLQTSARSKQGRKKARRK